ncbi:MAG: hypothetical protein AAGF73_18210 [Actinomycetota bacterium]
MTSQAGQLFKRLNTDAGLRDRLGAAHRSVLDDVGIAHDQLTDDELAAVFGGVFTIMAPIGGVNP